jgi:GAF domain-containing protein
MYFKAIDPTSLNKQGEDQGTRYRTGIYYVDPYDLPFINLAMAEEAKKYGLPLCVEVMPLQNFYSAEEYHQDYLVKNPDGYCHLPIALFQYARNNQDTLTLNKSQQYQLLIKQFTALATGETDTLALMANAAALIHETFHFWWTGYYRVVGDELVLGPFQGPVACMHIGFGKGVCGTSWKEDRTLLVPDVEAFPGHIACSAASRSEIVVPIHKNNQVVAVLDIDSQHLSTFDDCDQYYLQTLVQLLP